MSNLKMTKLNSLKEKLLTKSKNEIITKKELFEGGANLFLACKCKISDEPYHNGDCDNNTHNCINCNECQSCIDCLECDCSVDCFDCFECDHCSKCLHCTDCIDCDNCINCHDCYGCTNQSNKRYMVFNVQLSVNEFIAWRRNKSIDYFETNAYTLKQAEKKDLFFLNGECTSVAAHIMNSYEYLLGKFEPTSLIHK